YAHRDASLLARDDIDFFARDSSLIATLAGQGGGAGTAAVGAAGSWNQIENEVRAYAFFSNLTSQQGSVRLIGREDATIGA
ncbi:MAG: hypothetical protein GWO24_06040, partial [Akkermansiaceae bacterium]|nr:hypothetical protein [Akkermansiaceae bacterium]